MKKFVLLLVVVFIAASIYGCGKKNKDESSMEGLSGVVSENVVSVTDNAGNGGIVTQASDVPVVVDNAENATSQALNAAEGMAGEAVTSGKPSTKQIQQALKNAGFYVGKVDGDIGPKTKKSIEAFQSQNGLKADGKVGPRTWKALSKFLNKSVEVINPTAAEQIVGQ